MPRIVQQRRRAVLFLGASSRGVVWALIACVALLLSCNGSRASAAGWNDYELSITQDHSIFRGNSVDVMLCRGYQIILCPRDYPDVGPIISYGVTASHIVTKHAGRRLRMLTPGDTFENIDYSLEFIFITDRQTDLVVGPLSRAQFGLHPAVVSAAPIAWQVPRNPNILLPVIGSLMFLVIAALIVGGPWVILFGLLLVGACSVYCGYLPDARKRGGTTRARRS